jgi:uncharacterized protein YbjT (DUF2867 family)
MRDSPILILGATGRVGAPLARHLLARGARVRALVRDVDGARAMLGEEIDLVVGDLRDAACLPAAVASCGTIVFVAGANGLAGRGTPRDVECVAIAALIAAIDPAQVERFVLLSSAGVTQPEHPHNCTYNSVLTWKLRGEDALRRSGIAYTIVRALGLRDRAVGQQGVRIVQGDRIAFGEDIARTDLAAFLADIVQPREGDGFSPDFDRTSLLSATCEVFNDGTLAGGVWDSAAPALRRDSVAGAAA